MESSVESGCLDTSKILNTLQRLIRAKDFRLARAMANECIERQPQEAQYYRALYQVEMAAGRQEIAQLVLEELVRRFGYAEDKVQWYRLLYSLRDDETLLTHFKKQHAEIGSQKAIVSDLMCIVLRSALRATQLRFFESHLQWLETLRRKKPEYYFLKGIYHLQVHESQSVLAIVDEGYRLFPHRQDLLLLAGMAHFVQGELDKAQRMFQRAKASGSALVLSYLLQIETEKGLISENFRGKMDAGQKP